MTRREDPCASDLQRWVAEELAPWRGVGLSRRSVERRLAELSAARPAYRLYRFCDGTVDLLPPLAGASARQAKQLRAEHYLTFFRAVARRLPPALDVLLCVCPSDAAMADDDVPVFRFQKHSGDRTPLLPDIDFLLYDFYEDPSFRDPLPYAEKAIQAVFAGATTGARIDRAVAESCGTPRLRAAAFFQGQQRVDFRLPDIVQCEEAEALSVLRAYRFTQRPRLSWQEQFASRFLLSMDGNGATCSRIPIGLASNGVLLKYASEFQLFYFRALQPNIHFVPIAADQDVLTVLARELRAPGMFRSVADAASTLASRFLVRSRIEDYAARLIQHYAAILDGSPAARR